MFGPDKQSENGAISLVGHGEADRLAVNLAEPGLASVASMRATPSSMIPSDASSSRD
jgi:hypothetical protein